MSRFFYPTLVSRLAQEKSRYPLLTIHDLIDFSKIASLLRERKQSQRNDARGKQYYDPLKRFKAI
ncbi:MAG: hypothetical protein ACWIPH_04820 [Ostreibacterium sp.]